MTGVRRVAVALVCLGSTVSLSAWQAVFQSSATAVVVDVAVTRDGKPVADLAAGEFRLTDNGVTQTITTVSRERLPVDVTFVPDLSGRTEGPLLDSFRRAIDDVLGRLRAEDRASLVLFDPHIREVTGLERSRLQIRAASGLETGAATALLDAVAASLVRPDDPGRRRMVVVFSAGQDAASFLDEADVIDVAARSGVTIFSVAVTDGTMRVPQQPANAGLLEALAEATGGLVAVVQRDEDVSLSFVRAFEAFRTSYVLQYTPAGVTPGGWHSLEVRVTRPGRHDVRARKGYFGAPAPAAR
jgi:VWFA-related protein